LSRYELAMAPCRLVPSTVVASTRQRAVAPSIMLPGTARTTDRALALKAGGLDMDSRSLLGENISAAAQASDMSAFSPPESMPPDVAGTSAEGSAAVGSLDGEDEEQEMAHRPTSAEANERLEVIKPSEMAMTDLVPSLPRKSQEELESRGILHPSPIQAVAVPHLLRGLSGVVHSETGSGKTLAFLLPALERARQAEAEGGGRAVAIVLTPTRELTVQLMAEAEELCHGELALVALAAEASWDTILSAALIVATPQELLDVFDRQDAEEVKMLLARVEVCVLDEFDELLPKDKYEGKRYARYQDKGMWPTEGFLKRLVRNNDRQSFQVIAASATAYQASRWRLFKVLRRDQKERFERPLPMLEPPLLKYGKPLWQAARPREDLDTVEMENEEAERRPRPRRRAAPRYPTLPSGIDHLFWRTHSTGGYALALSAALEKLRPASALVFVCPNARESVRTVVEDLQLCGWTGAMALSKHLFPDSRHSAERKLRRPKVSGEAKAWRSANALQELRETTRLGYAAAQWDAPILVGAEENVRGLHLDAVEAVFILGMPKTAASYMHMAGRTGRLPHPFGHAVLVANSLQIAKVTRGFSGQTTISRWGELGRGSPSIAVSQSQKREMQRDLPEAERGAAPKRSKAASALDAALGPPVRRR